MYTERSDVRLVPFVTSEFFFTESPGEDVTGACCTQSRKTIFIVVVVPAEALHARASILEGLS